MAHETIDRIWWRNVQPGEFYNIERFPQIQGGGGSLYIEVPASMVRATLDFLNVSDANVDALPVITIRAGVVGQPGVSSPIEFHRKAGSRMRIARQNRQQTGSQRHPAWTPARGFPSAPDKVRNKEEALLHFPEGGLRIYIAKTEGGDFYAGFTKGKRPSEMNPNDPMWDLYQQGRLVGGVIEA
jgi:hypothetical protein